MQAVVCKCNSSHFGHRAINVNAYDPTRTLSLRNSFSSDMKKRFTKLRGVIRRALIDEDVLALNNSPSVFAGMTTPGNRAFDFPRTSDKVSAFMEWLGRQEDAGILEVTPGTQLGEATEDAWTNKYIQTSYQRGIQRARQQMRAEGFAVPSLDESGGLGVAFNNPFHLDRVGLLYTRVYSDLKGITDAMDTQISRVLSQAMAEGRNPRQIATLLTKTISGPVGDLGITDTLGRFIPAQRRAQMLARTEIIRAHSHAKLQEFKNWGVVGVRVRAEFVTAGDNRVCPECQALEGKVFNIDESWNIIPVHPTCRCDFIPTMPERNV